MTAAFTPAYVARADNVSTSRWCILGLACGTLLGTAAVVAGGVGTGFVSTNKRHFMMKMPYGLRLAIPLVLNIIVTLLTESMGYIHTCLLRWALFREGRLKFSSNLRLLSHSSTSFPNSWYINLVVLLGIVLSYVSTSLIFLQKHNEDGSLSEETYVNEIALFFLGLGLLIQAAVAGWCLLNRGMIMTWSSNPLTITNVCLHTDNKKSRPLEYQDGRCMVSVHMRKRVFDQGVNPQMIQATMLTAHPAIKWLLLMLWIIAVGTLAWGIVFDQALKSGSFLMGLRGHSWSFLPSTTGNVFSGDGSDCTVEKCTDGTSVVTVSWLAPLESTMSPVTLLVLASFQLLYTLALHVSELFVNLSRDEATYRELSAVAGTSPNYRSITAACKSSAAIFLCLMKACIHTMFGIACSVTFGTSVNMFVPQIIYLGGFTVALALFCTMLSMRRPTGFLPASFGHIQTITNVVDEWMPPGQPMFWGHKADEDDEYDLPAFAGTSSTWLEDPCPKKIYGGPPRGNEKHRLLEAVNKATEQRRRESLMVESRLLARHQSLALSRQQLAQHNSSHGTFESILSSTPTARVESRPSSLMLKSFSSAKLQEHRASAPPSSRSTQTWTTQQSPASPPPLSFSLRPASPTQMTPMLPHPTANAPPEASMGRSSIFIPPMSPPPVPLFPTGPASQWHASSDASNTSHYRSPPMSPKAEPSSPWSPRHPKFSCGPIRTSSTAMPETEAPSRPLLPKSPSDGNFF